MKTISVAQKLCLFLLHMLSCVVPTHRVHRETENTSFSSVRLRMASVSVVLLLLPSDVRKSRDELWY